MRPRDTISFINECLSLSSGQGRLTWNDISRAEKSYSEKRLLALRDEWKPTYQDIQSIWALFRDAVIPLSKDQLGGYLDDAMLLLSDPGFQGVRWMTTLSEPMWSSTSESSWTELYQPLVRMLYEIGFIGFVQTPAGSATYSYDNPDFANDPLNLDSAKEFFIHPAYHMALNIRPVYVRGQR